jgi:hypothetical protein
LLTYIGASDDEDRGRERGEQLERGDRAGDVMGEHTHHEVPSAQAHGGDRRRAEIASGEPGRAQRCRQTGQHQQRREAQLPGVERALRNRRVGDGQEHQRRAGADKARGGRN